MRRSLISSMRIRASSRRRPRPLSTTLARSPTLGSRRASAGPTAVWPARATRAATTTVRRSAKSATGAGVRGLRPRPSAARQPGVRRGAQPPLARAQLYAHWVGWPTTLSGQPLWRSRRPQWPALTGRTEALLWSCAARPSSRFRAEDTTAYSTCSRSSSGGLPAGAAPPVIGTAPATSPGAAWTCRCGCRATRRSPGCPPHG